MQILQKLLPSRTKRNPLLVQTSNTSADAEKDLSPGLAAEKTSPLYWRIAVSMLAFGLVLRLARYLMDFPLWGDETMLAVNFLDRSYLQLALPLDCLQISPILFSWIELTSTKVLGFSALSLRLFPMLCGLASLGLFWKLACHFCRGAALPISVAIFSVSYYLVRHSAEIKPYSSDLCAALLLLFLAVKIETTNRKAWWAALILVTPCAVLLSYPIVFVAGAVSLFLLLTTTQRSNKAFWLPWVCFNIALVGTFLANYWLMAAAHYERTYTQGVGAMWVEGWPPITKPLELLVWAARVHTGRMFSYPVGSKDGGSIVTFVLFAIGTWQLWRHHGKRRYLALFCIPFLLGFVAAAMQRYPYGGSARTMLYVAPSICLLAGIGGGWLIDRIANASRQRRNFAIVMSLLIIAGGANLARDLIRPYKTSEDARLDEFAQWFWIDYAQDCEIICAVTDTPRPADTFLQNSAAHDYLCWQRMYSARHRAGEKPNLAAVSESHPVRVVFYRVPQSDAAPPTADDALQSLPADIRESCELREHTVFRVNPHADVVYSREYVVFTFVPAGA